jgi:hypothetical protein
MGHAVLPSPPPISDLQKLLFYKINHPINRLESTLLQVFILGNFKPFGINTYEKQGEGCQLWLTKYYKKVSFAAECLTARLPGPQASLSVLVPHFPFSRFQFPFFPSALRLRASARQPVFHLPYALPSSVSCKPFICHSYRNTRGVGVFFPFWNSAIAPSPLATPFKFLSASPSPFLSANPRCRPSVPREDSASAPAPESRPRPGGSRHSPVRRARDPSCPAGSGSS